MVWVMVAACSVGLAVLLVSVARAVRDMVREEHARDAEGYYPWRDE